MWSTFTPLICPSPATAATAYYLLEESPNASVDKDDNKYYEKTAIVNGEITTVKATDEDLKIGLYPEGPMTRTATWTPGPGEGHQR